MPPQNPEQKTFKVRCNNASCDKPFHLTATRKSDEPGTEEIEVACPYCQTALIVSVPRNVLNKQPLFRGGGPGEQELKSRIK